MEELTYAWHLAYVKTGWEEPQKKQIADLWKNRFATFKGGNLYNASVNSIRQSTMQNSGQAGVGAGGETEEEVSGVDDEDLQFLTVVGRAAGPIPVELLPRRKAPGQTTP